MKEESIILVIRDRDGNTTISTYGEPYLVKNAIKEAVANTEFSPTEEDKLKVFTKFLWDRKIGKDTIVLYPENGGTIEVSFARNPGEYNVTESEVFTTLERFCNSGRSPQEYEKTAKLIVENMHRYVQSRLWIFVRKLIGAYATAGSDERNAASVRQATELNSVLENS